MKSEYSQQLDKLLWKFFVSLSKCRVELKVSGPTLVSIVEENMQSCMKLAIRNYIYSADVKKLSICEKLLTNKFMKAHRMETNAVNSAVCVYFVKDKMARVRKIFE